MDRKSQTTTIIKSAVEDGFPELCCMCQKGAVGYLRSDTSIIYRGWCGNKSCFVQLKDSCPHFFTYIFYDSKEHFEMLRKSK